MSPAVLRPAGGLLVDTNLLVLWVVGGVNRNRIETFKRTSQYTKADYDLLLRVRAEFKTLCTVAHGWADPLIPSENSIDYYKSVQAKLGQVDDSMGLFMVPGMGHCGGGEGPTSFDMLGAMEQWVEQKAEQKKAPESIVASHSTAGAVDRTRPLCAYPQSAVYKGSGSIDEAQNFECKLR